MSMSSISGFMGRAARGFVLTVAVAACAQATDEGAGSASGAGTGSALDSGSAASTASGTGSTTGGPNVPFAADAGCSTGITGTELTDCRGDADCACPELCLVDLGAGRSLCELSCVSSADCPSAITHCVDGACALNFCVATAAGASLSGAYGAACGVTAPDAGDGTCIPSVAGGAHADFGYCVPNGTARATCNPGTPDNPETQGENGPPTGGRTPASDYCVAGEACVTTKAAGGTCEPFCIPGAGGCPAPQVCLLEDLKDAGWGLCGACIEGGQACLEDGDCCTGSCDPVNGCAGGCDPVDGC